MMSRLICSHGTVVKAGIRAFVCRYKAVLSIVYVDFYVVVSSSTDGDLYKNLQGQGCDKRVKSPFGWNKIISVLVMQFKIVDIVEFINRCCVHLFIACPLFKGIISTL